MSPEQRLEAIKAITEMIKGSKMFQMVIAFFMLQLARMLKRENKCWQGIITTLQSICIGGYLSSEMEGELASLLGIGVGAGGTIIGAIACAETVEVDWGKTTEVGFTRTHEECAHIKEPWLYIACRRGL